MGRGSRRCGAGYGREQEVCPSCNCVVSVKRATHSSSGQINRAGDSRPKAKASVSPLLKKGLALSISSFNISYFRLGPSKLDLVASAHFARPHSPWDSLCLHTQPMLWLLTDAHWPLQMPLPVMLLQSLFLQSPSLVSFRAIAGDCSSFNRTETLSVLTQGSGALSLPVLPVRHHCGMEVLMAQW